MDTNVAVIVKQSVIDANLAVIVKKSVMAGHKCKGRSEAINNGCSNYACSGTQEIMGYKTEKFPGE